MRARRASAKAIPTLQPTKANNYDVLIEHYFQPLGILQAGYFYKQLSDPIFPTTTQTTDAQYPGIIFQLNQSINGPSAHIQGIETQWEQRFSFLPGLLSGIGVSANYSYVTSQITFPFGFNAPTVGAAGRTDKPRLERDAPNNYNFDLTYDKGALFRPASPSATTMRISMPINGGRAPGLRAIRSSGSRDPRAINISTRTPSSTFREAIGLLQRHSACRLRIEPEQ